MTRVLMGLVENRTSSATGEINAIVKFSVMITGMYLCLALCPGQKNWFGGFDELHIADDLIFRPEAVDL